MIRVPGWHSGRSSNSFGARIFFFVQAFEMTKISFSNSRLILRCQMHILQELLATRSADIVVMDLQLKIETTTAGIKTVHRVIKERGGTVTVSSQI